MGTRRNILVISGSRADYSLLYWPMRLLQAEPSFNMSVAVTGMHLADSFGHTIDQFERDGFAVAARIPVLGPNDSPAEMARAIGRGILGFVDVLAELKPDLVLLLGDRFEIFAAAQAAFVQRVPIAHLCGGDVTNGALDDGFRHAITKMASLHFVTNVDSARRVRQLGEMPERIYQVGSPGIDFIKRTEMIERDALERTLGHSLPTRFLLVTFHPVTLDPVPTMRQMEELLAALTDLPKEIGIVFTFANADAEGTHINDMIVSFTHRRSDSYCHASLGPTRFQSLMRLSAAVVGNSSSGLYEAPSLGVPSVDIGRRQHGRPRAASVIGCSPERATISAAIKLALDMRLEGVTNPFGDGTASEQIVAVLRNIADWRSLVFKEFADLPATGEQ